MIVRKYCSPKYNPNNGAALLLGTLEKYRKIEDAALQDRGEATYLKNVDISEAQYMTLEEANNFLPGFGTKTPEESPRSHDGVEISIDRLVIDYMDHNGAKVSLARASSKVQLANAFAFCCSIAVSPTDTPEPWKGKYKDSWDVESFSGTLHRFCSLISLELDKKIYDGEVVISGEYLPNDGRRTFHWKHGPINYSDRVFEMKSFSGKPLVDLDYAFVKPKSFSKEREYRFLFYPQIDGVRRNVLTRDVLVDLSNLKKPS